MSDGSRSPSDSDDDGMSRVSVTSVCVSAPVGRPDKGIQWWFGGALWVQIYLDTLLSVIPGWLMIPRSRLLS